MQGPGADRVPGEHQAALRFVPDRRREVALDPAEAIKPPLPVSPKDQLGPGTRGRVGDVGCKRRDQILRVIEDTVGNDNEAPGDGRRGQFLIKVKARTVGVARPRSNGRSERSRQRRRFSVRRPPKTRNCASMKDKSKIRGPQGVATMTPSYGSRHSLA